MPVGLLVMQWDDRIGANILAQFPEEIQLDHKTLMQIISTHEYSGDVGTVSLLVGALNISSFYMGPEVKIYVVLLLRVDEDPDTYEGGLSDISRIILQNLDDGSYREMLPSLYKRLAAYPTLNNEQKLAFLYQDEINRLVLRRLRDEGVFTKSELGVWLKDLYRKRYLDVDGIVMSLNRIDILKEATVKGISSELIFLTNDILMMRRPPVDLLKNASIKGLPETLVEEYRREVREYFQIYRPSEEDNLELLEVLTNPEVYQVLRLLRITIPTKNSLMKLQGKGVEDVDAALKILWKKKMINVYQGGKGIEYYALKTDFHISLFFPKYIVNTIIHQFDVKSKTDKVLIEYLEVLESSFYSMRHPQTVEEL